MQVWKDLILDNISEINAFLSVAEKLIAIVIAIVGTINLIIKIKLKRFQYKYLIMLIDKQTKESMEYYVSTRAQIRDPLNGQKDQDPQDIKLVSFFMKRVFKDNAQQYYIVLADSGMGKTTFLLKLFFSYYKKLTKKHSICLIPLSFDKAIDYIREVVNKQNTILLLDGLDEDEHAIEDYSKRLRVICAETELFYKVIITCRTQFFPDAESESLVMNKIKFGVGNKGLKFLKYYISPFNDKDINKYLHKKYNRLFQRNKIKQAKKVISNCPELAVRPMLLAYIDDLSDNSEKRYDFAFEIYGALVTKWIDREFPDEKRRKQLLDFSIRIAVYMYNSKTIYVERGEIEDIINMCNVCLKENEIIIKSLLNRNAKGLYQFAHKSIMEYLLAIKAFSNHEFRKRIMIDGFDGYDMAQMFLSEMSIQYIQERAIKKSNELKNYNFTYFLLPKYNFNGILIKGCSFEGCDLHEANLSSAVLSYANFQKADMQFANLQNAYLSNVNLSNANLSNANLKNAYLSNVNLSNANLKNVNLSDAKLKNVKLDKTDLSDAKLDDSNTENVKSEKVNLRGLDLGGVDLQGKDLKDAILDDATLYKSNLKEADLKRARLIGTNLKKTNMQNADLRGANLRWADLREADLNGTKLKEAGLSYSIWRVDDIQQALSQIKEADFTYITVETEKGLCKVYKVDLF